MNARILSTIQEISTQEEFDNYIGRVKVSSASIEDREKVIKEANRLKPQFSSLETTKLTMDTASAQDGFDVNDFR